MEFLFVLGRILYGGYFLKAGIMMLMMPQPWSMSLRDGAVAIALLAWSFTGGGVAGQPAQGSAADG